VNIVLTDYGQGNLDELLAKKPEEKKEKEESIKEKAIKESLAQAGSKDIPDAKDFKKKIRK